MNSHKININKLPKAKAKDIKKGLADVKAGRCHTIEEWQAIEKEWRKNNPVLAFLKDIWENIYYPCYRTYKKIVGIPREVEWFIQRGTRGWSDGDAFSLDYYLAPVIRDAVKRINYNSTPMGMKAKKWQKILNKISYAFDLAHKIHEMEDEVWKDKKKMKEMKEGMQLFITFFFDLWD